MAKIIYTPKFFYEKLNYVHNNPVEDMISFAELSRKACSVVKNPEDYLFSSARNYADMDGLLDVVVESMPSVFVS